MEGDIDIYEGGGEGTILLVLDALISV